jgi:Leucine-rich repeat (LRR) protein
LTGKLIEELGFLDSLHTLSLPYNENLGGQVPINLFGRVTVLDLQHNQHEGRLFAMNKDGNDTDATATMLANSSLEEIHMAGNKLSGSLPTALNQLVKLRVLALEENDLTGALPSFRWPALEILRLGQNRLSGSIPASLVSSSKLSILDLSQNTDIFGTIPSEIGAAINSMTYLGLANCQLDGTIPMELYSLTKLEGIELQNNSLQGNMASEIGLLSFLETMNWQNNDFVGTLPTQLGKLNRIVDFLINGNDFEGTIPLQFCDMGAQTFGLAFAAKVVADCQPEDSAMDAAEFKTLVCPEGCCSSCCRKSTGDCTLDPSAILGLKSGDGLP